MKCICSDCESVQQTEKYLHPEDARMLELCDVFMSDAEIDVCYKDVVEQHEYMGKMCTGSGSIPEAILEEVTQ